MGDLGERVLKLPSFTREYKKILVKSVAKQFYDITSNSGENDYNIQMLLTWASVLALSKNRECQDAAFRIAQFTLEEEFDPEIKAAAALVLDSMTNFSAVALAQKKKILQENYEQEIPVPLSLDKMRRTIENSIVDANSGNIVLFNRFQKMVYDDAEIFDRLSISAPTAIGKSFVLLHVVEEFHRQHMNAISVFLVPTRALVQQVQRDLTKLFNASNVSILVSSLPILPNAQSKVSEALVLTQERLQVFLSENDKANIDLLVVDEAQKIADGSRGILLQQVVEQVTYRFPNAQLIFSSPMTANPSIFLEGGESSSAHVAKSEDVTVNQNLLWVSQARGRLQNWEMDLVRGDDNYSLGTFTVEQSLKPESKRLSMIAYRLGESLGSNLIYVNGAAEAEKIAHQLYLVLKENGEEVNLHQLNELIDLIKTTVSPQYSLVKTLSQGVGFHYGNMPLMIKNEIERLFSEGVIRYLVSTSTLIEGVNLPAKSIFLRGPQKGSGKPMSDIDFWNLAGRAGRQGKEFQGNVICIDSMNKKVWKTLPPRKRSLFMVEKMVDAVVDTRWEKFIEFIEAGTPRAKLANNIDYEYAFTYFLSDYIRKDMGPASLVDRLGGKGVKLTQLFKTVLENYHLPVDFIERNPGISPIAQQNLYDYFVAYTGDFNGLIPIDPWANNAYNNYLTVVGLIGQFLSGDENGRDGYLVVLVLKWMKGMPLANIIKDNVEYWKSKAKGKSIDGVIRDTMSDIEKFARYKFPKYSTCYIDILGRYFQDTGKNHLIRYLRRLNVWLEFGASEQTQVSLISLGLSRTTAISLSKITLNVEMTPRQCMDWLRTLDISGLALSPLMIREIKDILDTH